MNVNRYYYANESNQPVGPFPLDQLQAMMKQSMLNADTQVCPEGGNDWKTLGEILGVKSGPPTKQNSGYQDVAEKVGLIPDFSAKRNLIQLAITAPVVLIFAIWGASRGGGAGAVLYGFGGLLVGVLASGTVLMLMGWKKK